MLKLASKYHRLPLTALRTFEAAARQQSFKQAAEELFVTPATVSNQIRQLEKDWKCQLFIRRVRQVELTEAGLSLARVVSRAFDDIQAEISSQITLDRKTVTLAVGPIFASRWLIPRLSRFRRQQSNVELVLKHGPRIKGIETMGADIAVDWGDGYWTGLESTHLMNIYYLPVLSPLLAKENGGLNRPSDLARFRILHNYDRSEWSSWFRLANIPDLKPSDETVIADSNVALQAALDGQGVALGTFPFIQAEVDSGRLICPLDISFEPARSYHLLTRPGGRNNAEVAAVWNWLTREAHTSVGGQYQSE